MIDEGIYQFLNEHIREEYLPALMNAIQRKRQYKRKHTYSLEQYGFTYEELKDSIHSGKNKSN